MLFREATLDDVTAIANINREYLDILNPPKCFTFEVIREEEITKVMLDRVNKYYVAETSQGIVGYIEIGKGLTDFVLNSLHWYTQDYSEILLRGSILIEQVTVKTSHRHQGVATFLYEHIRELYRDTYLTAFVSTKPTPNIESLGLHRQQGFEAVGHFSASAYNRPLLVSEFHLIKT